MQRRHRLWSCTIAIALLMVPLSGAASARSSAAQVTITWLTTNLTPVQQGNLGKIVKDFESLNPTIKVNVIPVAWANFETKLSTMVAAGTPPDVWYTAAQNGQRYYATHSYLLDLAPYVKASHLDVTQLDAEGYKSAQFHGQLIGLPLRSSLIVLAYNKTLFDKAKVAYPPSNWDDKSWTWDKFVSTAQKLTLDSNGKHPTDAGFDPKKIVQWGLWGTLRPVQYAWLWGGDWFDVQGYASGLPKKCIASSSKGAIIGLQKAQDLIYKQYVTTTPAQQLLQPSNGLLTGKVGMYFSATWDFPSYQGLHKFKMGLAALPRGTAAASINYVDVMMVAKSSPHPQEAFTFVKYMISPRAYQVGSGWFGAVPISKAAEANYYSVTEPTFAGTGVSMTELKQTIQGAFKYGKTYPSFDVLNYGEIENKSNAELDRLWQDKENAVTATKNLCAVVDPVLQQNAQQ
jgi:multiple sugar transport system substrate-binding protein